MSQQSIQERQLARLTEKLDAAIRTRATLEEDFKAQSSVLTAFIGKLSNLCKGLDLELDNRLAKLRVMLTKSLPFADIEQELKTISALLNKQATKNEKSIREMHEKFHLAGKTLQKVNGIPADVRRNLRELLNSNPSHKDAIIQYIPKLSELIELYVKAINKPISASTSSANLNGGAAQDNDHHHEEILNEIINILDEVELSDEQKAKLEAAKQNLKRDLDGDALLEHLLHVFHIIIDDIRIERKVAKSFLSTLSSSLATVQKAVSSTISETADYKKEHKKLNDSLSVQISDLTSAVEKAATLSEIKEEVNEKLAGIAQSITAKNSLEVEQFQALSQQMQVMQDKVVGLEQQSQQFERRLAEQKQKSLKDALTKLNNRAAFDEFVAYTMAKFQHEPFPLSVAIIDLDDFKSINDTFGHTAGDKTLQVVATIISSEIDDSVFAARYGGEEFVLIFKNWDKENILKRLNRIRKKIAKIPFKFKNTSVNISASFGVTHVQQEDNIHTAFERADQALYQAKENGKNQVIYG